MIEWPLKLTILSRWNKARATTITLPHGPVDTPVYMPVGTKGTIKGLTSLEMKNMGCQILLGNTYHLGNQPGCDVLEPAGGLHEFMNWKGNILTDSGGFQMVSLLKLSQVTERGVEFQSPVDESMMLLTPEESMRIQNVIGADIMMALDDVVAPNSDPNRVTEAAARTTRWLDRGIAAHGRKHDQNLFGIVQGAVDPVLRQKCLEDLVARDLPGYAIGGLAGGEYKGDFWRTVLQWTEFLPQDKPRYLMGVGYPVDLVVCSWLGVDMFDCVYPTRTARFGTAITRHGLLDLKKCDPNTEFGPIDETCTWATCMNYSRSYLAKVFGKEAAACHFISLHNLTYLLNLMKDLRTSIITQTLDQFVRNFMLDWYGKEEIPEWVHEALSAAGIQI